MIIGYKNNVPQKISIKRPCDGYYLRWYYNGWHYWFFLPGRLSLITEGEKYRTIGTKSVIMGTGQITYQQCQAIRTILNTREVYILTSYGWRNVRIEPGSLIVYDNQVNGYEIELNIKIGSKEISQTGFSPVADVPIIPIPDPRLCEVIIGTQIWMCKNYDSDYPGSKVYNNDEANRLIYGGLYNKDQILSVGFCPTGWHVPTFADWMILINYVGGLLVAAGELKEVGTNHWNSPNTGAADSFNFSALGSGNMLAGVSAWIKDLTILWTSTPDGPYLETVFMYTNYADISFGLAGSITDFLSVRLIKYMPAPITYSDYFLPSKDELNAMYNELKVHSVGNFLQDIYWSSTETGTSYAAAQSFINGAQSDLYAKYNTYWVRACRAFTSTINYNLRDIGPAGGWIFWKSGNDYLEAANSDISIGIYQWSNLTATAIGATARGTAIGTGQANTTAIINQVGHTDSAAKLCNDLVIVH